MPNLGEGNRPSPPGSPSHRGPDHTAVPHAPRRRCPRDGAGLLGLRLRRPAGTGRRLDAGGRNVPVRARLRGSQRDGAERRPPDRTESLTQLTLRPVVVYSPIRPAEPRLAGPAGPQGLVALGHRHRARRDGDPARTRRHRHRRARLRLGVDQHGIPVAPERRPGGRHVDPHRLRRRHGGRRAARPARAARHRRLDPLRRCAVRLPPRPLELPAHGHGEVSAPPTRTDTATGTRCSGAPPCASGWSSRSPWPWASTVARRSAIPRTGYCSRTPAGWSSPRCPGLPGTWPDRSGSWPRCRCRSRPRLYGVQSVGVTGLASLQYVLN